MSTIKAGYRMTVESWENDADHYNTVIKDGLNERDVKLYIDILKLTDGEFGNMYEPTERELNDFAKAVEAVFDKHNHPYETENLASDGSEIICDFCGYSEYYFTRVVDKITVEYIPQDIIIEDVTKQFGV
jgi:hypothetical protein